LREKNTAARNPAWAEKRPRQRNLRGRQLLSQRENCRKKDLSKHKNRDDVTRPPGVLREKSIEPKTEKHSGASGVETRGKALRLNANRGRAVARLERSRESDGALAGGETEKRRKERARSAVSRLRADQRKTKHSDTLREEQSEKRQRGAAHGGKITVAAICFSREKSNPSARKPKRQPAARCDF
jgi:hypothetical protein